MDHLTSVRSLSAAAVLGVAAVPTGAAAASVYGAHVRLRGAAPEDPACAGVFPRVRPASERLPSGHTVTASLQDSNKCGAYARQDSPAKAGCLVAAARDPREPLLGTLLSGRATRGRATPVAGPTDAPTPAPCGQHNLAPLTRNHHRAVTFAGWRRRQPTPGTYLFRSPHGHVFLTTHHGTLTLGHTPFADQVWDATRVDAVGGGVGAAA